jgi:putative membrane protein
MFQQLPYCGAPPLPSELIQRFNLDPALLVTLAVLGIVHVAYTRGLERRAALLGWSIAAVAFVSPLCALSVALFSARIAQHMMLILLAAPLIARGWARVRKERSTVPLWSTTAAFTVALWFWHMPRPYDATFHSTATYWAMHVTLFGSAILLWRELWHHAAARTADVLAAGLLTSMQMGLLGAVLTFAAHPLFIWHLTTTQPFGLSPLHDQQLGGVLMWVPGIALFLLAALRSFGRLWRSLDEPVPQGSVMKPRVRGM